MTDTRGGRSIAVSLVFLWLLSACHSRAVVDQWPSKTQPVHASESPQPPSPPLSAVDMPADQSIDVPIETPAIPPCLPVPPPAPPKRRSKPKPKSQPAVTPSPATAAPAIPEAVTRALDSSVVTVLGKKVQGADGEDLGRVVDVLADASGRVRVAVIEFGGFLGVGNRRIAVDWSLLRFDPSDQSKALTLSVSKKKLQSAPEFKDSARPQALVAPQLPGAAPAPSAVEGKK